MFSRRKTPSVYQVTNLICGDDLKTSLVYALEAFIRGESTIILETLDKYDENYQKRLEQRYSSIPAVAVQYLNDKYGGIKGNKTFESFFDYFRIMNPEIANRLSYFSLSNYQLVEEKSDIDGHAMTFQRVLTKEASVQSELSQIKEPYFTINYDCLVQSGACIPCNSVNLSESRRRLGEFYQFTAEDRLYDIVHASNAYSLSQKS